MRINTLLPDAMTEEQRKVYDAIRSGPRGRVHGDRIGLTGPFNAWIRAPGFADLAQQLGAHLRFGTSLPARLSELAIIVVGRYMRASFEFAAHAPLAVQAGLSSEAVEAIRTGAQPALEAEDEAAVYAFSRELVEEHDVADATYARLEAALGEQGVVEVIGLLGYYTMVSMTLNVFQVPLREGMEDPFTD
jgi:4-carboxymuconolactone decarboxylase